MPWTAKSRPSSDSWRDDGGGVGKKPPVAPRHLAVMDHAGYDYSISRPLYPEHTRHRSKSSKQNKVTRLDRGISKPWRRQLPQSPEEASASQPRDGEWRARLVSSSAAHTNGVTGKEGQGHGETEAQRGHMTRSDSESEGGWDGTSLPLLPQPGLLAQAALLPTHHVGREICYRAIPLNLQALPPHQCARV